MEHNPFYHDSTAGVEALSVNWAGALVADPWVRMITPARPSMLSMMPRFHAQPMRVLVDMMASHPNSRDVIYAPLSFFGTA